MNGEQLLEHVYNLFHNHRALNNRKPKFLYISLNEWVELTETDFFKDMCMPVLDGRPTILGMEIVRVDKDSGFIRVGE